MTAYAREKFSTAIQSMASSAQSIQDRLYRASTIFLPVKAGDFEEPKARLAFEQIHEKLTSVKDDPQAEGLMRVTTRQMSDVDASALAKEICEFYFVDLVGPE